MDTPSKAKDDDRSATHDEMKDGKTALMSAIECGNYNIALELINDGPYIDCVDNQGETALVKAVNHRNTRVALALIKSGAHIDVNITDEKGETLLQKAVSLENEHLVLQLIKGGAHVNINDEKGKLLLLNAVSYSMSQLLAELIKRGADVNITDEKGETLLQKAVCLGNEQLAQLWNMGLRSEQLALQLIKGGAHVNINDEKGELLLLNAVGNRMNQLVAELINRGADVNITNEKGETLLQTAVGRLWGQLALQLIQGGADVNITDAKGKETLLKTAVRGGREQLVLQLIKSGADVNITDENDETLLQNAVSFRNEQLALQLIKGGAHVNINDEKGKLLLQNAVTYNMSQLVAELINRGADVNITDEKGETLLQKALNFGREQLALQLIKGGAHVNINDEKGKTLMMRAVDRGMEELSLELVRRGANVNILDWEGNSVLVYAVRLENVVSAVIREGKALVNAKNCNGRTPLFYAILEPNDSARYLLENGGKLLITDNFNVSILSYFIYDCIKKKSISQKQTYERLVFLKEKGIEDEGIVQAILNAVFCKLPLYFSSTSENILPMLRLAVDFDNANSQRKRALQSIVFNIEEDEVTLNNLPDILSLLFDVGADPKTADESGNTACHYLAQSLLYFSGKSRVMGVYHKLENLGLALSKKNCNQETPLMFLLSNVLKQAGEGVRMGQVVEVSRFLLKDPTSLNETSQNGMSVFHFLMKVFQKGLNLEDEVYQKQFLDDTVLLMKLFCTPQVKKVTVNKVDDELNSPLHYWATLSLPSVQGYHSKGLKKKIQEILDTILKHLRSCGVLLNARNEKEETPLHLCKTWSAVKLLVDAGANTNDVDLKGRRPLLVAAQNRSFLENADCFYPDVTEDSQTFWRIAVNEGFDLWSCDKDGDSVISNLIKSEAFVLAKALVEVACDESCNKSDQVLVSLLNAICKDKSSRTTWKAVFVEIILRSRRKPNDLSTCLRLCCKNIIESTESQRADSESTEEDEEHSVLGGNDTSHSTKFNIDAPFIENKTLETTVFAHMRIVEKLLYYGVNGECCLDLADGYPALKDILTKRFRIDEVPMVLPWNSYSKMYKERLAEVARRRNCKIVEGTTYWHHNDHIASGTYGHVFAGINEKDGMEVAIKRIETLRMVRPEDKREIRTFAALTSCKQIVQYQAFSEYQEFSYITLELMEGNLDDYFRSDVYDPVQNITLSKDVVMGLKYLHNEKIIHRDLKPSNILYKTHPNLGLKIADFGLSRSSNMNFSVSVMSASVGTRGWIAPEVVKSKDNVHSASSDIFSCGLILHYLFSKQKHPFNPIDCTGKSDWQILTETESNIFKNRMEGWYNSLPAEVSHLVQRMLEINDKQRPSASDLLDHPMFWSDKKKMDLLSAVGNQPEFECPRAKRPSLTAIENELNGTFSTIVTFVKWNDVRYTNMSTIYAEMTQPIVKTDKKGKTYTIPPRKYDTGSVVELVRFIRNAIAHVSDVSRTSLVEDQILSKFVFLKEFPNLVMEVYKAVIKHGWDARKEIQHVIGN